MSRARPSCQAAASGAGDEGIASGLEMSRFHETLDSLKNTFAIEPDQPMKTQTDTRPGKAKTPLYGQQWWLTVQSMPLSEALVLLRDYRAMLLRENAREETYIGASAEISRINAEIHRMTQVIDRSTLIKAMRNVLPAEMYEAVLVERERLELFEQGRQGKH